jgi:hypothetical protein
LVVAGLHRKRQQEVHETLSAKSLEALVHIITSRLVMKFGEMLAACVDVVQTHCSSGF